ncbi:MAG: protein kinase [Prochlorococcaceae cyanobacterium]
MTLESRQERRLKVIVFSDVVDSSAQIFADELIAIQRIKEDLSMIREILKRHGGSLVKSLGDGILATFDGPTQALEFVEDAVIRITRRGHLSLQHRFGLHTGEIYVNGDDIIGQGVHLASRLQTTAPVNGVAFVQSTFELVDPRFQRLAELVGPVQLKGLPVPVVCYVIESQNLIGSKGGKAQSELDLEGLLTDTPYRLERPLGMGLSTSTFLVREEPRGHRAVLKLIPCDASNLGALEVEAACLDRLRHPRVPRFVDGLAHRGSFLFLQEYITGASLQGSLAFLRKKQRLAELLRQVLEVLEVIHAAGIVHGDLHPSNLICGEDGGAIFVVNFELLKAQSSGAAFEGERLMGRPFFSPPERARFGSISPAGDLYTLGVLGLCLFTGQGPEELYDQVNGRWRLEGLDREVVAWLAPMLEDSLARRVASASDALQLLDRPNSASPAALAPPPPAVPLAPLPNIQGVIRKAVLGHLLVATYGPVVELLLESFPSSLPSREVEALRQRLVAAGLSISDVDRALQASLVESEPARLEAEVPSGAALAASPHQQSDHPDGPDSSVQRTQPAPPPDRVSAWRSEMLLGISDLVGPIAEVICTEPLFEALLLDPASARHLLLASAVPPPIVEDVLALAERTRPTTEALEIPPPPGQPTPTTEVLAGNQLREVLLDLIGPIGTTLLDSVAHLPRDEQAQSLIRSLEGYGVDHATITEVQRRLELRPSA